MTFTNVLSAATSGLTAAQTRAQVVAENIANATNPTYVRRTAEVSARIVTSGIDVIGVSRADAGRLTLERLATSSDSAFESEKATATATLSRVVGEPGAETGLFGAYVRFEQALRDAAASPESDIYVEAAVDAARDLTNNFNSLAEESAQIRTAADDDIAASVTELNGYLERIAEINAIPLTSRTPTVLDELGDLVGRVNDLLPVNVVNSGDVTNLYTRGGVQLVGIDVRAVEFSRTGAVVAGDTLGAPLSGLTVDAIDVTPGTGGRQALDSGKIAGLFAVRDEILPDFEADLDALATDVITRFSDDTTDPTKPAGETGLFTTLSGGTTPPAPGDAGVARQISLSALFDDQASGDPLLLRSGQTGNPATAIGDGTQLTRFLDALTDATPPSGGLGAAADRASDLIANVQSANQRADSDAVFAAARADGALKAEVSEIGVDTDAELQELLLIEQAYTANAQVIRTVTTLLQELRDII